MSRCPDCNKTEGNCICHLKQEVMSDNDRYRLNLYETAPRGKVLMALIGEHPLDKSKAMLMFGVEYDDDVGLGAGSIVCFIPKEVADAEPR